MRLYGVGRLNEAGEAADARDAHAGWVESILPAETAAWPATAPGRKLLAERDNQVAALDWLDATGDLAKLGRVAASAYALVGMSGWVDDGWRYFGRADVEATLDPLTLAGYLVAAASTANALGDFPRQAELAERALSLEIEPGSLPWRAATRVLANALSIFEPERSARLYDDLIASIPPGAVEELGYALARSADPSLMTLDLEEGARRLDEAERVSGLIDLDFGLPHLLLGRMDVVRRAIVGLYDQGQTGAWTAYRPPLLEGLLAATDRRFGDAAASLVAAARRAERLPLQLLDQDLLNGFAVLAHHEGDQRRAAALLAAASAGLAFGRSPGMYALHMHYRQLVRPHLEGHELAEIRAQAGRTSAAGALGAELARVGSA